MVEKLPKVLSFPYAVYGAPDSVSYIYRTREEFDEACAWHDNVKRPGYLSMMRENGDGEGRLALLITPDWKEYKAQRDRAAVARASKTAAAATARAARAGILAERRKQTVDRITATMVELCKRAPKLNLYDMESTDMLLLSNEFANLASRIKSVAVRRAKT